MSYGIVIYTCPKTNKPCELTGCVNGSFCRETNIIEISEIMTDNIKAKGDKIIDKFHELIYNSFKSHGYYFVDECDIAAKKASIKAVEEIINTLNRDIRDLDVRGNVLLDLIEYWREVLNYLKSKQ